MKTPKLLLLCFILLTINHTFSQQTVEEETEEIVEAEEADEEFIQQIPFAIVEEVPVFPGCTGSLREKRNCFNDSLNKHVAKNFNTSVADNLDVTPGKKAVYIRFIITSTGDTEIIDVRTSHEKIKQEAIRVIKTLPKMKAGKQRGRYVDVPYMLPIKFYAKEHAKEEKN